MNKKIKIILVLILLFGAFFRLYHIEFGLPQTFYADEPEIVELAIKYTFELRSIISNNDYYKLIPISFVYGTLPAYLNTFLTILFSKSMGILGIIFEKWHIYVFLRIVNALLSLTMVYATFILSRKLFKNNFVALLSAFLIALNWKLIVHAHYINADILQTIFLTLSFYTFYKYYKSLNDNLYTILTGILFGLAVGTKITTLIGLPLYLFIYIYRKDYRALFAFLFIIFGTFMATNPFSFILATNFAFRIYTMVTKEAGMVFDSVDLTYTKYIFALGFITTPIIFMTSLYGKIKSIARKDDKLAFHLFLILHVLVYLLFFTIQSRRVDRWLLPIIPIVILYASFGIFSLREKLNKYAFGFTLILILISYLYFPALLLTQFQRYTPKGQAYLWMQENLDPALNKLAYTEEGLDPINKLPGARVLTVKVYTDEAAQFFTPESPNGYDYVIISSRPLQYYKKDIIKEKYPFYFDKWNAFETELLDETKFKVIKEFTLTKPNLIPLSDVFIYENTQTQ